MTQTVLAQLLAQIAEKNETAFTAFYEATVDHAFGLAARILRSETQAEEVLTVIYFQVWKTAPSYDPDRGSPLAWLLVICRSRALDALRATRGPMDEADADALVDDITPDSLLEGTQQASRLHRALTTLGRQERICLALSYYRGLSQRDIERCTGIPLGTVKKRLKTAIQSLREYLLKEEPDR